MTSRRLFTLSGVIGVRVLFAFVALWLICPNVTAGGKRKRKHRASKSVRFPKTIISVIPLVNAESPEFQFFLRKLSDLKNGKGGQANVFILGDSHMQCEDFGTALRRYLTDSLGVPYAGRGFVFPYPLAKTSHRSDMLFGPSINWRGTRFTKEGNVSDWGLAGWTAHWDQDSVIFHWRSTHQIFRQHDELLVFSPERCAHSFQLMLSDSSGYNQNLFYNHTQRAFVGTIGPDNQRLSFKLKRLQPDTEFVIQGFLLRPKADGLVCGISGTNGARLDHYLQNPDFQNHLKTLDPDLMVICLGTNEAFASGFSPDGVRKFLQTLLSKIKSAAPNTAILLVGPPDHKNGKKANPKVALINQVYAETAEELDFTFWNQQQSMGGAGSVFTWRRKKLATTDMVHFTTDGYRLQAALLGKSIRLDLKKLTH